MNYEHPTTSGGGAAAFAAFDLGAILGGPFRDRAPCRSSSADASR